MYRLRRTTTTQESNSSSNNNNTNQQQLSSSEMRHLTQRIHVLEDAYQEERHQRDLLEKKYARLKRRYIRLERARAKLILDSHVVRSAMCICELRCMNSRWRLPACFVDQ